MAVPAGVAAPGDVRGRLGPHVLDRARGRGGGRPADRGRPAAARTGRAHRCASAPRNVPSARTAGRAATCSTSTSARWPAGCACSGSTPPGRRRRATPPWSTGRTPRAACSSPRTEGCSSAGRCGPGRTCGARDPDDAARRRARPLPARPRPVDALHRLQRRVVATWPGPTSPTCCSRARCAPRSRFAQCPGCDRVYWPGAHAARLAARRRPRARGRGDAMTDRDLAQLALTYAEVGATAGTLPPGYHHLDVTPRRRAGPRLVRRGGRAGC